MPIVLNFLRKHMNHYPIEKNVPMPAFYRKYPPLPLDQMSVGDSFLTTLHPIKSVRSMVSAAHKNRPDARFTARLSPAENGIRVWRTA